mmetsp:Transcript_45604/g.40857  ORF Transcript_45604/g.40857 Transcript_45604/m.40857 type:complete len:82 (-) Transcript_45604:7-252(-)
MAYFGSSGSNKSSNNNIIDGCSIPNRGIASGNRSIMESNNIYNKKDYKVYSEVIHCDNFKPDCQKSVNMKPIAKKYYNPRK